MNDSNRRITAAAIVAALLCGISAARLAESSIRLDVQGLDLSKPEVVARVYLLIEKSAARVCRDSSSPWDAGRVATRKHCVAAAIDAAVQRARQPLLTALHQSKQQRGDLAGLTR